MSSGQQPKLFGIATGAPLGPARFRRALLQRFEGSVYRYFKTILQVSWYPREDGDVDRQDYFDVALAAIFDYDTDFFEECFPGLIFTVFQSFFHKSVHYTFNLRDFAKIIFGVLLTKKQDGA